MSAELVAALMFLTRFPVGGLVHGTRGRAEAGEQQEDQAGATPGSWPGTTGAAAFGLVGALIGAAGAIPLLLLGERAPLAAGVLAVGAIALVSGALHLDGLADTVDALAAPSAAAADRARKDPRIGPAGAAAVVVSIVADAALLAAVLELQGSTTAALACVVAAAGSRAVAPGAARLARRHEPEPGRRTGLGARFVAQATFPSAAASWLTAVVIAAVAAVVAPALALGVAVVAGTLLAIGISVPLGAARGGLDGDGLGFLVELGFSTILLVSVILL